MTATTTTTTATASNSVRAKNELCVSDQSSRFTCYSNIGDGAALFTSFERGLVTTVDIELGRWMS